MRYPDFRPAIYEMRYPDFRPAPGVDHPSPSSLSSDDRLTGFANQQLALSFSSELLTPQRLSLLPRRFSFLPPVAFGGVGACSSPGVGPGWGAACSSSSLSADSSSFSGTAVGGTRNEGRKPCAEAAFTAAAVAAAASDSDSASPSSLAAPLTSPSAGGCCSCCCCSMLRSSRS